MRRTFIVPERVRQGMRERVYEKRVLFIAWRRSELLEAVDGIESLADLIDSLVLAAAVSILLERELCGVQRLFDQVELGLHADILSASEEPPKWVEEAPTTVL